MSDSDKPVTALEAVEQAANPAPEPEQSASSADDSQPQPDTTPEAATDASSEGTASEPAKEEAPGPIPFDRHKSALENARQKAAEEAVQRAQAEWKDRYGWAETYDRAAAERQAQRVAQLDSDPIAFYRALGRELESHPHLGPQFRAPEKAELPKPSLQSADGRSAYTAEEVNAFVDARMAEVQADMARQLQQVQQGYESLNQVEANRVQAQKAQSTAREITEQLNALPGAKEHQNEIRDAFAAIPRETISQIGMHAAAYQAYLNVFQNVIQPEAQKQQQAKVREEMQKKAGAATVDPSGAQPTGTARPKTRKELAAFMKARSGVAS